MSDNTKVLVVEDDPSSLQYLVILLKNQNLEVLVAETGEKALQTLKENAVKGMFFDIALGPGISGLELMEQLREDDQYSSTPVIAVTAYEELRDELMNKGFSDFLSKPFTNNDLVMLLKKHKIIN